MHSGRLVFLVAPIHLNWPRKIRWFFFQVWLFKRCMILDREDQRSSCYVQNDLNPGGSSAGVRQGLQQLGPSQHLVPWVYKLLLSTKDTSQKQESSYQKQSRIWRLIWYNIRREKKEKREEKQHKFPPRRKKKEKKKKRKARPCMHNNRVVALAVD